MIYWRGIWLADHQGRFHFADSLAKESVHLMAVAPGHLPATMAWTRGDPVPVLRLGGPPHSISGRVVDAAGQPRPNVIVRATNLTDLPHASPPLDSWLKRKYVEDLVRRDEIQPTGQDGTFRIEGLLDREYSLRATNIDVLTRTDIGPVRAGSSDLKILLLDGTDVAEVRVRVVDDTGRPVPKLRVQAIRRTAPEGPVLERYDQQVRTTDEAGRVHWPALQREGLQLETRSTTAAWHDVSVDVPRSIGEVQIIVEPGAWFKASRVGPKGADGFQILDENDDAVVFRIVVSGSPVWRERGSVERLRRRDLYYVPLRARELVLLRGETPIGRVPLELERGALSSIDLNEAE